MKFDISYIIITIFISIIGYALTLNFGSDYTFYFVTADFLGDNRVIYKDFFTHKGPLYYIFLYSIKLIFDSNYFGYQLGFILTLILFSTVFYFVIKSRNKELKFFIGIAIVVSIFFEQNSNSSIQYFQSTFLLLFIYFLNKFEEKGSLTNISISTFFLSLSILIRIDSAIYFLIPCFLLYNKKNELVKYFFSQVFILFLVYYLFKLILGFSNQDFINHNFLYNYLYGKGNIPASVYIKNLIFRKQTFILLCATGTIFYFDKIKNFKINSDFLFLLISFFLFVSTLSDKDYHILILLIPLIYYISIFIKKTDYNFLIVSTSCALLTFTFSIGSIIKLKKLSNRLNDDYRLSIVLDEDLNSNSFIYGGEPYINFFLKDLTHQSINNAWFYRPINFKKNQKIIEDHNKGINSNSIYFINEELFLDNSPNRFLEELKKDIEIIKKVGKFYKVKKLS